MNGGVLPLGDSVCGRAIATVAGLVAATARSLARERLLDGCDDREAYLIPRAAEIVGDLLFVVRKLDEGCVVPIAEDDANEGLFGLLDDVTVRQAAVPCALCCR